MVSAGENHLRTRLRQPHEGVVQQADHVNSRQGAIVDITGDQDNVHFLVANEVDQLVNEALLGVQHADAVERPAQVPIGSVQ